MILVVGLREDPSFSSFYIGNPKNCKQKKIQKYLSKQISNVNIKHGKKSKKIKKRKRKQKLENKNNNKKNLSDL